MFRQCRTSLDELSQFGVFLHNFVQAGGQDRICVFCKWFVIKILLICLKGFESPWGYWLKAINSVPYAIFSI